MVEAPRVRSLDLAIARAWRVDGVFHLSATRGVHAAVRQDIEGSSGRDGRFSVCVNRYRDVAMKFRGSKQELKEGHLTPLDVTAVPRDHSL